MGKDGEKLGLKK